MSAVSPDGFSSRAKSREEVSRSGGKNTPAGGEYAFAYISRGTRGGSRQIVPDPRPLRRSSEPVSEPLESLILRGVSSACSRARAPPPHLPHKRDRRRPTTVRRTLNDLLLSLANDIAGASESARARGKSPSCAIAASFWSTYGKVRRASSFSQFTQVSVEYISRENAGNKNTLR